MYLGTAFLAMLCMASMPYAAHASTSATISNIVIGSIDVTSLVSESPKPTLSGFLYGATTIEVLVRKAGTSKILYKSKPVSVKNMGWKTTITKKLSDGAYDIEVRGAKSDARANIVATGTLAVGTIVQKTATTLAVSWVPLLAGGIARAGASVPVAYLQVTNVGKLTVALQGFYIKQNGSAATDAIAALTTVDDKATLHGATAAGAAIFTNGVALAPTNAIFPAGQMRLFTVRAVIASNTKAYVGKQLQLSVTGINTIATGSGAFPFRGVTWVIQ